jgi:hypothetical protein
MLPPCARRMRIMPPHCTAHALRAVAAANATLARFPSKVFKTRPRTKGGRGVRYVCTSFNANHVSQARMLLPFARLVRITPPTVLPRRYSARTIVNAQWQDFWLSHEPRALVRRNQVLVKTRTSILRRPIGKKPGLLS